MFDNTNKQKKKKHTTLQELVINNIIFKYTIYEYFLLLN